MKAIGFYQKSILSFFFLMLSGWYLSAQTCTAIVGGTNFEPLLSAGTAWHYLDKNQITYLGPSGNSLNPSPSLASTDASFGGAGSAYGIVNNPSIVNPNYIDIDVPMMILSGIGGNEELFSYDVWGLKPGSTFTITVEGYLLNTESSACATTAIYLDPQLQLMFDPQSNYGNAASWPNDNGNSFPKDRSIQAQKWGGKFSFTNTLTLEATATGFSFVMKSGYNYNTCLAIGISKIEIKGCLNPKISSTQGNEVCTGEQVVLSLDRQYYATSYQWQKKVSSGTWTNVGGNNPVLMDAVSENTSYRCLVDGSESDVFNITTVVCCEISPGISSSRRTIYYDNFGLFSGARSYTDAFGVSRICGNDWQTDVATPSDLLPHTLAYGSPDDGYYVVSTMARSVLNYLNATIGVDASGDPRGGVLCINIAENYKGVIYKRQIDNLCPNTNLYFEVSVANASYGQSTSTPPEVEIRMETTSGTLVTPASFASVSPDGYGWYKVSIPPFSTPLTSVVLVVNSTGEGWKHGNDLLIDDIIFRVCAPPVVETYSNLATLMKDTVICSNSSVKLETKVSDLLTNYYGAANIRYLYQMSEDGVTWKNITGKLTSFSYTHAISSIAPQPALGSKLYFRMIVASNTGLDKFVADPNAEEDTECVTASISQPITITIDCPCLTPDGVRINANKTIGTKDRTITLCMDESVVLSATPTPSAQCEAVWFKTPTRAGTTGTPLATGNTFTVTANTVGTLIYFVKVRETGDPARTDCWRFDSILVKVNPVPAISDTIQSCVATPLSPGAGDDICFQFKSNYANGTYGGLPAESHFIPYQQPTGANRIGTDTIKVAVGETDAGICFKGNQISSAEVEARPGVDTLYHIYLEDVTTMPGTLLPGDFASWNTTQNTGDQRQTMYLEVTQTIKLESVNIYAQTYSGSKNLSVTPVIYSVKKNNGRYVPDAGTNITAQQSFTYSNDKIYEITVDLGNYTLTPGTYFLGFTFNNLDKLFNNTSPVGSGTNDYLFTTPFEDNIKAGGMALYGLGAIWQGQNATSSYIISDLKFSTSVASNCGRVKLTSKYYCPPCIRPDVQDGKRVEITIPIGTKKEGSVVVLCPDESVVLTARQLLYNSFDATDQFDILWYQAASEAAAITPLKPLVNAGSDTYTITSWNPSVAETRRYYVKVQDHAKPTSNSCWVWDYIEVKALSALDGGTVATNQTICYDSAPNELTSTVAASGGTGTYTYQWQISTDNGTTWTNISGAITATYTPGTLTATTQYRREAKNSDGTCEPAYSNAVTITVNPELEPGTISANQTICYNATPDELTSTTTASGGTGTYTYQWQITTDNGATWANISSATAATYTPGALTSITQYRREAKNSNGTCDAVYSNAVTITVNPELQPGIIANNQTICYNAVPDELTSTTIASGGTGTYTYQWQISTDNGTTWTNIGSATATNYAPGALTATTQYRREARNSDGTCTPVYSNAVTITVNPELEPASISDDQTICYNGTPDALTLATEASGGTGDYTYQWQISTDNSATWTNISSATATTYTSGALISTTQFRLQASNSNGTCTSVYSNIVTVTVNSELQPGAISGNQTICYNAIPEELTSTTAASGGIGTYSYQWQVSTDNGTTWTNIGGATATTYTPGALIATTQYRRGASNSDATCATVYSSAVTVTVNPELEPGTIANNQTICYNSTPEALTSATTATGGTGTYAYQWQISTDGGTTWTNINSATATTYAPGTLTATTQYRREASNSDGTCDPVYSNAVTITVNPELEPASISDDQTICYNGIPDAFALATSASGGTGTYTYQWQSSTDNGITWTNISSETATTYTSGALISTTQFRLQASNSNGTCASVYSNAVTITVNSELQPGTISGNQTICYNAIPDELTSTTAASGGAGTYAYQWQVSTDNGTTWTNIGSATAITYVPGTLTTTTQYRREAKNSDGTCDAVYSNAVTVTVNPELEPGIIANNQTICYNSIPEALTSTTATGGTGTYVYQWQITTDGGTTWTNINSATATTYAPGTLTTTTQYRREASNSNGTCDPVYSNAVTITVNPELEPGSISDNQTICYNAIPDELTSAATASGGIGTYVYQWQNSTDNGVTWTNIDGATASAYTPVALTTTTQYRREARNSDGACDAVYSNAITITVKPKLQPGVIADNQTICYNAMADELTSTAAASGGFGTYAYQWQYSTDNGTTWADIAGATAITYAPGILTSTMQFRRAATGGDCGTVYSDDITITVNSLPTDKLTNPASFCEGTLTTEPSKTMGGYNIIWYDDALGSSVSTEPSVVTQTATNSPYTFYYKVQDALTLCYGSMNTYEVTVDAIPLAPNTTPVDMLKDSSPNPETIASGATADSGHTLYWYATETSPSGSTSAPSQDKSTAGTYYYWVSQKNDSGCESERVKVTVNVYDAPLPSVSNATYCQDETPALLSSLATADAGHTLYWYSNPADVKGSGSTTMPIISTSTPGTYTFYVSQRNNTTQAESEKAAITITVHPLPVVPSITLDDFCQGGTAPSLGGTISGLTIEWQDASGSPVTSISSSTGNTPGVHNYTAIATDANGCVSAPSTIPVEVIANPTIPTVNNDVVYYREDLQTPSNTFKDLMMQDGGAVTASSGSTLYWSADGLSWSTTPPVPPTPSEDDYTDKSYTYKVKQMLDGPTQCESPSTTVEAKIYLIPVPKVKKISYCEGETPSQLSSPTVEVDPTGGYALEDFELRWHGTGATPSTGYTTAAPTPSASTPGTTTYWVSQYNKGTLASSSPVKLEVIVYAKPTLSITAPLAVCSPLTVNISGNSGVWNVTNNTESFPVSDFYYEDINKTTILSTPGAIPTIGKRDYYIQVAYTMPSTAGGDSYCYSEVNPVEVNIEDLDKPVITGVSSTCPNTAVTLTAAATSTNPGTVSYSWSGSNSLSGTSSSISTGNLAGSAGDSYTFSVTASAGTCSQTSDIHTITIGDGPVEGSMTISEPGSSTNPSVTFNNDQISDYYTCGGSVTIHTSYTGSDFQWKEEGSPTSFPGGGDLNVTPVGTKTYILSYVNGCPTEVKVKIHSIPLKVDSLYNSLEMCEGEPFSAKLNISCSEIPTIQWYKDSAPYSGSSSDKLELPTSKPSDSGVYSYKVTNRGCEVSGQIGASALKVKPYIQFTNQAEYVVERGEPVTMPLNISVPSSPSQPSTIEWKENGVIVNTQTSYTIPSVTQDHHFKIKLSDPDYCDASSTLDVLVDAHLELKIDLPDQMCYGETKILEIDTTGTGRFVEAGHMLQVFETIEMIRKEVSGWTLVGGKLHLEVSPKKDASYEVVFTYKEQKVTKTTAITVLQPIEIVVPDIQTICEGESVTLSLKSVSPAGTTVEWFDQGVSMNEFSETIIATPAFTPGSGHQSVYTYRVKANYSICEERYYDVEVKVDEPLRGTLQAQSPICEGNSSRLDASGYEAASYIWTSSAYSGEKSGVEQIERPTLTTEYYVEMSRGTCSHTDSIEVEVNTKPRISYIDSINVRIRKIIPVDDYGTPPFSYGVDNVPVDLNPVKENLVFGKHTFYIIDMLDCRSESLVYMLEAPKISPDRIFNPEDPEQSTWRIGNIELFPNAVVTIFDRFGKQLIQYRGSDSGWDGKYLGRDMPTTDYWYEIDIEEIDKQYIGHFTLMRK